MASSLEPRANRPGPTALRAAVARACAGSGFCAAAGRMAGLTFLIRVASAAIIYLSHILMARWMGGHEFGIYVYVWTWLALLGMLTNLGLGTAAQRVIPEYTAQARPDMVRGFVHGGRWLSIALGLAVAALSLAVGAALSAHIAPDLRVPLALAAACIPLMALSDLQYGIACAFDWTNAAFLPSQIARPLIILAAMAFAAGAGLPSTAVTAMAAVLGATAITTLLQTLLLNRRLAPRLGGGPSTLAPRAWLAVSLPMFLVESFYLLLTFTDVLVLERFRPPEDVAVYFAALKTLALVSFIHYAVTVASAHRFSALHVAGERDQLATFLRQMVRWSFWPSLALTLALLAAGKPILWLFGPGFVDGYGLIFVLAVGLMARAALGPVERLLTMSGQQMVCAGTYAAAFALNLVLCLALIPSLGTTGAAISTALSMVFEAAALLTVAHRRLHLPLSIWLPTGGTR